jgi:hypothetical protein
MRAMGMPDEMIIGQVIESVPAQKLVQTWHPLFNDISAAEPHTRLAGAPMVAEMVPGGGNPSQGGGGWPWGSERSQDAARDRQANVGLDEK